MDNDTLVLRACDLEGQPVSGRDLHNIVSSYSDGMRLATEILKAEDDFRTKFIVQNESYVNIRDTKLRVCHNLQKDTNINSTIHCFIHGLGGNLEQFEPLLRLIDLYGSQFIAIDLPGFGKSGNFKEYSMSTVVDIVKETFDKLIQDNKIGKKGFKFNIIGHSMGCYISLQYFERYYHEYNIDTVVLMAPPKVQLSQLRKGYTLIQLGLSFLSKFPSFFDYYRTRFDQSKGLKSSGIEQFFHKNNDDDDDDGDNENILYRKLWQFHNNIQIKSESIIGYLRGWEAIDWHHLREIIQAQLTTTGTEVKLLIISGTDDKVTPIDEVRLVYETFPKMNSKKFEEIKGCSHNICFDCPEKVCTIFLKDVLNS